MSGERARIQVEPSIPRHLNPYRPDWLGRRPKFITNGSIGKAPFLHAIGIELHASTPALKQATDHAEEIYHKQYGDEMFGPYMSEKGVPYPVVLASEKMKAAIEVMQQDGVNESFFTHDACYMLRFKGREGKEITIHKPKSPEDVERVARLLYWASTTNNAHLYSISGVARYDEASRTTELYSTEADLGEVKPFDMAQFVDNLETNPTIALGTFTYRVPGLLVQEKNTIPVTVTKYNDANSGEDVVRIFNEEWTAVPGESATAEFAADTPQNIQLAGLGLIQW